MRKRRRVPVPTGISTKIILPILLVVGMFTLPAFLAWRGMIDIQEKNVSMRDFTRSLTILHQIQTSLRDEFDEIADGFDSTDPEIITAQIRKTRQRANRIGSLKSFTDHQPEAGWLNDLENLNNEALTLLETASPSAEVASDQDATDSRLTGIFSSMIAIDSRLIESFEVRDDDSAIASNNAAQDTFRTVILTIALTGILGLAISALLTRRIVRPVDALVGAAREFSGGNFASRVSINGNDELTDLGNAFNNMASSLQIRTEALVKEQTKLRSIHQSITDGILVFGNHGFVVSANPAAEAILEKTEAALAGSRVTGIEELDTIIAGGDPVPAAPAVKCWEFHDCHHDDCPAHGSDDLRCWLQCGDYCQEKNLGSGSLKGDECERCPVFRANGCASADADMDGKSYSISVAPMLNEKGEPEGRLAVIHDMTDERYRSRQMSLLYEIVNTIASANNIKESLRESLELCISAMNATSGSIMLIDEEDRSLVVAAQKNLPEEACDVRQHLGEGIAGWVAERGEPLLLIDDNPDPRFPGVKKIKDAVCIPIRDESGVVGVLSLNERQTNDGFDRESLDFLGPVAVQMGMALSRARLHEKIVEEKEKSTAIVECMGESLCVRAPDRTILFANSAHKQIFGEDCVGQPCYDLYMGRDSVCRSCPLDRCFESGVTVRRSHFVLDRLGNRRQLETTASPIRDADGNITSCIEVSRDVTEMLRIKDQAASRLNTLTTLFEVSSILSSSLELNHIVENFADSALQAMRASTVAVMMFQDKERHLVIRTLAGETGGWAVKVGDIVDPAPYGLNELISGVVPFSVTSTAQMTPASMSLAPPHSQSVLVGRLSSRGRLLGLITVSSPKRGAFSQSGQMELFMDVTNQAAVAIDNAEMYQRLEDTFWSTIRSLAEAIDAKDSYTRGHSDRVAEFAEALARRLELEEDLLNAIRCAGYLHDTGKIGIPDAILLKPGRLTEEEYSQIMGHPIMSHKIIEPVDFPYDVKPLVRHHHEHIDGSGYPDGLKGEEIPLGARIIGIADAFEAMTSDRPYRKALSFTAAVGELRRCAGTQFDAALVDEFLGYLGDDNYGAPPGLEDEFQND